MSAFRILLAMIFRSILGYAVVVGVNHGWNLLAVCFGDMAAMTWAGQVSLVVMPSDSE